MSKKFQLVQTCQELPSQLPTTDWKLCVICQEETSGRLNCPAQSKRSDSGRGYTTLAANLIKFNDLGKLPRTIQLERIEEGDGVEAAMVAHKAKWHHTCMLRYNTTMLRRAEKRPVTHLASKDADVPGKRTRARSSSSEKLSSADAVCFFCGESGKDVLHEVTTFQLDQRVRDSAELVEDTHLLAKLKTGGDLIAQEAKYHKKCLVSLYNRAEGVKRAKDSDHRNDHEWVMSKVALAELVLYMEETRLEEGTAPVFRLADLANLYTSRLEQFGIILEKRVNSTRLKERLLAQLPGLRAQTKGRDVLLAFDEDIGEALGKACEHDSDSDALHLARAARIVRRQMFENTEQFTGTFADGCQGRSVPSMLLALVNMILAGPNINSQISSSTQAALSIAQLMKFNGVKHGRKEEWRSVNSKKPEILFVKHNTTQETPLPTYIGLMLHAKTRKKRTGG